MTDTEKFWTEREAARYLSRRQETLRAWRKKGTGPEYIIDPKGRVHYDREKVKDWMESTG